MGRQEDRAERFQVRRASASEAQATRGFLRNAMIDRLSWVAARTLLERVLEHHDPASHPGDCPIDGPIRTFLERHPDPIKRKPEKPLDLEEIAVSERDPAP